jgi:hypothetical protein
MPAEPAGWKPALRLKSEPADGGCYVGDGAGFCSGGRGRGEFDQEGDAGLGLVVEQNVDGVKPWFGELQLLDIHDEGAGGEVQVVGQGHFDWDGGKAGHDRVAVTIDEVDAEEVLAFVGAEEGEAQGDGALGVDGRELAGVDGVEGAEEIELAVVIGGGIAQDCNLDVHG